MQFRRVLPQVGGVVVWVMDRAGPELARRGVADLLVLGPRGAVDKSAAAGLIDRALGLAADRYGEQRVANGKGDSASGLAKWWTQENAVGARARANDLLRDHDLTATQLADALLSPNPPWLRHYRKPLEEAQ